MKNSLQNKNILFVLPSLKLGGAERQAIVLARYLKQNQKAHVKLLGFGSPGKAAELCDIYAIPWQSIKFRWPANRLHRIQTIVQFGFTLRQYKPDILLPYSFPTVICGLSWRLAGARLCVWNQRNDGSYLKGTRLEQLAVHLTPRFISNSHHGVAFLTDRLNVAPNKIAVVYNGIELSPPREDRHLWRKRLKLSEDDFVAGMVANLRYPKDHITLLKAWRLVIDQLSEQNMSATLLLAGRLDEAGEALKALAYDLDLGKRVRFLGKVDDIAGFLNAIDLGVFSSLHEGLPNGVLECMAAGLSVVGTDIPGIREAVGETSYRWLAAPEDANGLAAHIVTLAENITLRNHIGQLNRQRITEQFSLEQMGQATTSLLVDWLA